MGQAVKQADGEGSLASPGPSSKDEWLGEQVSTLEATIKKLNKENGEQGDTAYPKHTGIHLTLKRGQGTI